MDALNDIIRKKKNHLKNKIGDKRTYKQADLYDNVIPVIPYKKEAEPEPDVKTVEKFSIVKPINPSKDTEVKLSRPEIINILRKRNEPIRCFGETDFDVYQRMKIIQLSEPKHAGLANDFKAAMEKVDKDAADEIYRERDANYLEVQIKKSAVNIVERELRKMRRYLSSYCLSRESVTSVNRQFYNVNTNDNGDQDGQKDIEQFEKDCSDDILLIDTVCDYVLTFLKYLLAVWGSHLNSRPKEEKATYKGRNDSAQYNQTVDYIRPLFRLFKDRRMSLDILDSMVKITSLLLDRNYLKANEAYLELAIGNAPWPLGVTNHGIHARTAQEKIHAKNVAHVLNDEVQRKYIQAIKRLITRGQKYFPTDPKRSVNFTGRK